MKVIGAIIYLIGFLGVAFVITETRIDIGGSFGSILLLVGWLVITMGIGTALMKLGNNNNKQG